MIKEKDIYREKLEAQMKELKAEIDRLSAKIERMEADGKLKYRKERSALQEQLDKSQRRIKEIKTAGTEAWDEIRQGTEKALEEISQSLENARSKF
jgi:predicted  nucleic acid-binding Zn-ribbon protein